MSLLQNGAAESVNLADKDGKIPLHLAAISRYEWRGRRIVGLLLKNGAAKSVNFVDMDCKTPLHLA
ncbi:hypothetical protein BKA56DRAFT_529624, partial [Ilyonectria sp. MPI-CAGE-AT-0026]